MSLRESRSSKPSGSGFILGQTRYCSHLKRECDQICKNQRSSQDRGDYSDPGEERNLSTSMATQACARTWMINEFLPPSYELWSLLRSTGVLHDDKSIANIPGCQEVPVPMLETQ